MRSQPLSNKAKPGPNLIFPAILGFAGLILLLPLLILPVSKILRARDWQPAPCVIVSSAVGKDSSTGASYSLYSIDIVYKYTVGNRQYKGKHYHFMDGESIGYASKAAVVKNYPPGKNATCYVNPRNPSEAVIERGFTPDLWPGIAVLVFIVAVGARVFFSSLRRRARPAPGQEQPVALRSAGDFKMVPREPRELKPATTRLGKFILFTALALVFSGFTIMLTGEVADGWRQHHLEMGASIFALLLSLISFSLIAAAISRFIGLFNPDVHLTLAPGAATLGEAFSLEWTIRGRVSSLARLRIVLECSEKTSRRSAEHVHSVSEVFSRTELLNTTEQGSFAAGRLQATVPRNAMHSFEGGHNKIVWMIRVEGEIPKRPRMDDEYTLTVLPVRKGALA